MTHTIRFDVFRYDREAGGEPGFQSYDVPASTGLTVLGGLLHIQERLDGSLAFRYACRAAVCGSCAVHVNGEYRLACETQVADLGDRVTIRPLAHLEVIKDLVVDMEPFWRKYRRIKPYLVPGTPPPAGRERPQGPDDRARIDGLVDCILCAACYAGCSVCGTDPDYLGPAALAKLDRFLCDSRDGIPLDRLGLAGGVHGVWRCHTIFRCQEVCPKDVDPAGAIADLKMKSIRARLLGR